jgi:hypothetical protein
MKVFVPIACRSEGSIFGSTLFLKTIRTGFPTADITLVMGPCIPPAIDIITAAIGPLRLSLFDGPPSFAWADIEEHGAIIRWLLEAHAKASSPYNPIVFCDSDVVFWESMEDIVIPKEALFAGRYAPEITDLGCRMAARVHPSLFIVPNARALMAEIETLRNGRAYLRPFEGYTFYDGSEWRMFDDLASLYSLLGHRAYHFGEAELDKYDHLFCGTYLDQLDHMGMSSGMQKIVKDGHKIAQVDLSALRGFWRRQAGIEGVAN